MENNLKKDISPIDLKDINNLPLGLDKEEISDIEYFFYDDHILLYYITRPLGKKIDMGSIAEIFDNLVSDKGGYTLTYSGTDKTGKLIDYNILKQNKLELVVILPR